MTKIVNLTKEKCDIKITRKPDGSISTTPNINHIGYFGNPFTLELYGREECLRLYRLYFQMRIQNDAIFRANIESLRGKILGCFCKPLPCHGDIIKEYLDGKQ